MIKLRCMLYFESISDPSSDMDKKYDQLQIYRTKKGNSCWLGNNTKMLSNDIADINIQKSRKYKEENNRSYPKRFSSLVALMPALRAGFSRLI